MARSLYRETICLRGPGGLFPLAGAEVRFYEPDGAGPPTTPIGYPLYPDAHSTTAVSVPYVTGPLGELEVWADLPHRVRIIVGHVGYAQADETIDLEYPPESMASLDDVAAAIEAHEDEDDPHNQYLTPAEADLAYVKLSGGMVMTGSLGPKTDGAGDLGGTTNWWNKLWAEDIETNRLQVLGPILTTDLYAGYLSVKDVQRNKTATFRATSAGGEVTFDNGNVNLGVTTSPELALDVGPSLSVSGRIYTYNQGVKLIAPDPAAGNALTWSATGLYVPPIPSQAATDDRYVNATGDVMTGALNMHGDASAVQLLRPTDTHPRARLDTTSLAFGTGLTSTDNSISRAGPHDLWIDGRLKPLTSTYDLGEPASPWRRLYAQYADFTNPPTIGGVTLDDRYVNTGGDTMTGSLVVNGNISTYGSLFSAAGDVSSFRGDGPAWLHANGLPGYTKGVSLETNGNQRWSLVASYDLETGGNAGSNLWIQRLSDAGGFLGNVLDINRATGAATFGGDVRVTRMEHLPVNATSTFLTGSYSDSWRVGLKDVDWFLHVEKTGGVTLPLGPLVVGAALTPASGAVRLVNGTPGNITWRNATNTGDLTLGTDASNNLLWNGNPFVTQAVTDPLYVNVSGDSMTGPLNLTGPSTSVRVIYGQTVGLNRWGLILGDNTAEGGANSGSHFGIGRYNDAGNFGDYALSINRTNGAVTIPGAIRSPYGNDIESGLFRLNTANGGTGQYIISQALGHFGIARDGVDFDLEIDNSGFLISKHKKVDISPDSGNVLTWRTNGLWAAGVAGSGISQADADARYLQLTGGVLTGPLTVGGNLLPSVANTYTSGDLTHEWYRVWTRMLMSPGSLYLGVSGGGAVMPVSDKIDWFGAPSQRWADVFSAGFTVSNSQSTNRMIRFLTDGTVRWGLYADAAAETGSNAGSDFAIARYADNGGLLGDVLTINRATGNTIFNSDVRVYLRTAGKFEVSAAEGGTISLQKASAPGGSMGLASLNADLQFYAANNRVTPFFDNTVLLGTPDLRWASINTVALTVAGQSADDRYVNSGAAGDTMLGSLAFEAAGDHYGPIWARPAGSWRWYVSTYGAETGSNAGTNFALNRMSDAAAYLGAALTIDRATGATVVGGTLSATTYTATGGAVNHFTNTSGPVRLRGTTDVILDPASGFISPPGNNTKNFGSAAVQWARGFFGYLSVSGDGSASPAYAAAGAVRLRNGATGTLAWRNAANTADLTLGVDANDDLTLTGGASGALVALSGSAGTARTLVAKTGTSTRWTWNVADEGSETGSNAGSNFALYRHTDAGGSNGASVLSFIRATGQAFFNYGVDFAGAVNFAAPPTVAGVSFDDRYVNTAGDTMTGPLVIAASGGLSRIAFNGVASDQREFLWTTSGSPRWQMQVLFAETGSNAGSDFYLRRYSDAGADLGVPLAINRATGAATFGGLVDVQRGVTTDLALTVRLGAEANPRWRVRTDGAVGWGPGGATAEDTFLYRLGVAQLRLDSYLGVGVSPAAWIPNYRVLQVGSSASLYSSASSTLGTATLANNTYIDAGGEKAMYAGTAARFVVGVSGGLWFQTAASALQNAAQTFTTKLAMSNLGLLTLTPAGGSGALVAQAAAGNESAITIRSDDDQWAMVKLNRTDDLARWLFGAAPTSKDFQFARYNDAGSFIDFPFVLSRATGTLSLAPGAGQVALQLPGNGVIQSAGQMNITTTGGGHLYLQAASTYVLATSDNSHHLGHPSVRWITAYLAQAPVVGSSLDLKQDIAPLDQAACVDAVLATDWVSYEVRPPNPLGYEPPPDVAYDASDNNEVKAEKKALRDEAEAGAKASYVKMLAETASGRRQKGYVLQSPDHKVHELFGLPDRKTRSDGADLAVVACALQSALQRIAQLEAQIGAAAP